MITLTIDNVQAARAENGGVSMFWEHPEFPEQQFSLVIDPRTVADVEAAVGAETVVIPAALQRRVVAMAD